MDNSAVPDISDRPITVTPVKGGIELAIGFSLDGDPMTIKLGFDRAEARELARMILWGSGDAIERTFPQPKIPEAIHG